MKSKLKTKSERVEEVKKHIQAAFIATNETNISVWFAALIDILKETSDYNMAMENNEE